MTWIADREKALTVLHLREAPVFTERTSVGLDVHARSVVGCGLDTVTGETARRRVVPTFEGVTDWLAELPAPVAVAYEAGPTGFGLARQLTAAGIRCVVAAPSKLQRPPGDRVNRFSGCAAPCQAVADGSDRRGPGAERGTGGGEGSGPGPGRCPW